MFKCDNSYDYFYLTKKWLGVVENIWKKEQLRTIFHKPILEQTIIVWSENTIQNA